MTRCRAILYGVLLGVLLIFLILLALPVAAGAASSVSFSGDSLSIDGALGDDPAEVTFAAWVRKTNSSAGVVLAYRSASNDLIQLTTQSFSEIRGQIRSSGTGLTEMSETGISTLQDVWHHLAVVYDRNADSHAVYRNGASVATDVTVISGTISATKTTIAGFSTGGAPSASFVGELAHVHVYDRALSPGEVKSLYRCPNSVPGAKAYLPLMSGSSLFPDLSGSGNNGTENGSTAASALGPPVIVTCGVGG